MNVQPRRQQANHREDVSPAVNLKRRSTGGGQELGPQPGQKQEHKRELDGRRHGVSASRASNIIGAVARIYVTRECRVNIMTGVLRP